jgi:hypothetical protein
MQKIVVGILAVFFVQICFQVFNTVERTNDEFAAMRPAPAPAVFSFENADVESLRDSAVFAEPQAVTAKYAPAARERVRSMQASYRRPVREVRTQQARELFPTIVINVPRPSTPVPTGERAEYVAASIRKRPERSFPKKALRAVTKPFDWLKTGVAKLF